MIAPVENNVPKLLLSLSEAAEALSVCERTVSRLVQRGEISKVMIGNRGIRIPVASLENWIRKQEANSD
jgi:excisionase family DNA binding protein